jgi:hypothetical protein
MESPMTLRARRVAAEKNHLFFGGPNTSTIFILVGLESTPPEDVSPHPRHLRATADISPFD